MLIVPNELQVVELFDGPNLSGVAIGKGLRMLSQDDERIFVAGSLIVRHVDVRDVLATRGCIVWLVTEKLASVARVAEIFGVHRNTVANYLTRYKESGTAGLMPVKPCRKVRYKVTPVVLELLNEVADLTSSAAAQVIWEREGVSVSAAHVRRLRGAAAAAGVEQAVLPTGSNSVTVRVTTDDEDGCEPAGPEAATEPTGTREGEENWFEPAPIVPVHVRGCYMGMSLYFGALEALGLTEVAEAHFSLPRSERFGVRGTFLSLFFLSVLGKPTIEGAKHLARESFGAVIGTGVGSCVKTLRRKLSHLVSQKAATEFGVALARRWIATSFIGSSDLYVDGHVKAYTGKRNVQKMWSSQRRLIAPGVLSYFVGDQRGRPLLLVSEDAAQALNQAMPKVIGAIREVLGEDARFTLIFDRGGYDSELFTAMVSEHHVDFITYAKGAPKLAPEAFRTRETEFESKSISLDVAEDKVRIGSSGPWRRIVVRSADGHQTPILTSLSDVQASAAEVACAIFARWRQENCFKYMKHHLGLDTLVSNDVDPVHGALIPNPERKRLSKEINRKKREVTVAESAVAKASWLKPLPASRDAFEEQHRAAVAHLVQVNAQFNRLVEEFGALPRHIPAADAGVELELMRRDAKIIVDYVKMTAYNAEEWMLAKLRPHYKNPFDVRDLLRSFAHLSGEMRSTADGIVVTLRSPDTPLHRRALIGLCETLSGLAPVYPGTSIRVQYRVSMHNHAARN